MNETVDPGQPGGASPLSLEYWSAGGSRLRFAAEEHDAEVLLPPLQACMRELRRSGEECGGWLAARTPDVIAAGAERWMAEMSSDETAARIAADCRMSPEMVREASANFFPQHTASALRELRDRFLQPFPGPWGSIRPLPPSVVFHVPAGNLFLSGIESLVHASLCGSCSFIRTPSRGGQAISLWLSCVEAADPEAARMLAVGRWPRECSVLTRAAAEGADAVIAFGADESVRAVRNLAPVGTRFLPHGAKLSFAVIGEDAFKSSEAGLRRLAAALAYDFTVYDQQGCLSPRAAFLQASDPVRLEQFGRLVRDCMADLVRRLPPPALDLEESAALARTRDGAAIEAAAGGEVRLLSRASDPFVVTLGSARDYSPGCLNRYADLRVFQTPEQLSGVLARFRSRISTVGMVAAPWADPLWRTLRVPRLCGIGQMQKPPMGWTHDGLQSLSSLLDWTGSETQGDW